MSIKCLSHPLFILPTRTFLVIFWLIYWSDLFNYHIFIFKCSISVLLLSLGTADAFFADLAQKMRLRGHELAWERSNSDKKRAGTRGSPATGRSNGCWSDIRKRNKHSLICHLCIPKNRNSYFHIIFMKYWNLIKYNIWWLHRCWWRIMETECVGDKFEMLVTDLIYRKNHHYSEKSGQHNDSANNISNRSPS